MDFLGNAGVLSRRALLRRAGLLSAGGLLANNLAGRSDVWAALQEPVAGGELFVAEVMDPLVYDPHLASSEWVTNLSEKLCDKLVYMDPQTRAYQPGLAESWEVAPDGLSITFRLRQGVTFHDGTPFDADAVKFNLDRIADPATGAAVAATFLGPYDHAEIVDDATIKAVYKAPYAPGLDSFSLGFFAMVSPAAVQKFGEDFGHNIVGTGPFAWSEYKRDDSIGMVRNPNYAWSSPIFTNRGAPYLDKITYRLVPDHATRAGMIRSKQVHILEGVPEVQVEQFRQEGFTVVATPAPGFPGAALINTSRPPTDDVEVRRAINYGTNREAIARAVWFNVWPAAHGPLTKANWAYDPAVESYYPYDPDKARQTLEAAGWAEGDGGIRQKNGQRLELSLIYAVGTWTWTELFQAQMKDIGIDVKILQVEPLAAGQASAKGEANISPTLYSASDPSILGLVFHSRMIGMFNWTFYNDPQLDSMLDQAITIMDVEQRKKAYSDIQKLVMDQALIIPLAETVLVFVLRPEVHDLKVDPRGLPMYLQDVWLK
ncbi:MAG TPA: ABC transporter substrate-binding protein [Thermomicrobiales bacterium]|nr:ABC transporter substrate-binding protein [Thermomicrobiales bacterium]